MRLLRLSALVGIVVIGGIALTGSGSAAPQSPFSLDNPPKIDVLGVFGGSADETSLIGPCGVWHQLYGIRCGIVLATRGESSPNAAGAETGPALGLRHENEDRAANYRSGAVEIFDLDRPDFFFDQSAPETQSFWGHDETLGRLVRIIRMTSPDILVGFTPTLGAGTGQHQVSGRLVWEAVTASADPSMFPDQLAGPHALATWQVKKVFSGGSTAGTGGTTTAADCTTGFIPTPGTNLDTVAGVWSGYDSPYLWPTGNIQGQTPGTPKIWAQVASEGGSAFPTQSRVMFQGTANPGCSRFGMTGAFVPFQPNANPDGTANPLAGKDNAILYGAKIADPGGLPLGTLEYLTFSGFFNVAGQPFTAALHLQAPASGPIQAGTAALTVPTGWTVDGPQPIGPIAAGSSATVDFTVTPSSSAVTNNYKISALFSAGSATGYTDNVVRIVPAVEGRFHRWGKYAEYDQWLTSTTPQADRLGRSAAVQTMAMGETISFPVDVHNWSTTTQSGTVTITTPSDFTLDATSKPYGPLAPGADTQVTFTITNTDTSVPGAATNDPGTTTLEKSITIGTSFSSPASSASETLTMSVLPVTTIPVSATAPVLDGQEDASVYTGPALDLSRKWSGSACSPAGIDCGTSGNPGDSTSTYARLAENGDNLYAFVHVRDDFQSYAVTPAECAAHWLADSVELMIDPRGSSSRNNADTATTFKLGIFPFTNDPSNSNGDGVNGPCWERDGDNHQGYSTGPLAASVVGAPNAPGVQVVSTATWVGSNETTVDHGYGAAGGYDVEVKIPLADLPSAVGPTENAPTGDAATNTSDPQHLGLNIAVYDEDNTAAAGQTTLRHIDQSTRLAWSNDTGNVQADPFRWGHAYIPGYTPPAGRSTTPTTPIIGPSLDGTDSPQTIYQSARDGVPISGRDPAPADDSLAITGSSLGASSAGFDLSASGPGAAHFFLWAGDHGAIPVFLTSCVLADDPAPDFGFTPCAIIDGGIPPWSPDMSGRVIRDVTVAVSGGAQHVSIPLDSAAHDALAATGSALVSFETATDQVQAFDLPLAQVSVTLRQDSAVSHVGDPVTLTATVAGASPFPGTPTGQVQFQLGGSPLGAPVSLDAAGKAALTTSSLPIGTNHLTAEYLGDGDYGAVQSNTVDHQTQGVAQQLAALHGLIAGFGLDAPLANALQQKVTEAQNQFATGRAPCGPLGDLLRNGLGAVPMHGLSFGEMVQLLDAAYEIEGEVGCIPAGSPRPAAEDDLVGLMQTIAGMGLSRPEADGLTGMVRDAAKQLVGGPISQVCTKLAALSQRITHDTGKTNGLTAAQASILAAAVGAIRAELNC